MAHWQFSFWALPGALKSADPPMPSRLSFHRQHLLIDLKSQGLTSVRYFDAMVNTLPEDFQRGRRLKSGCEPQ